MDRGDHRHPGGHVAHDPPEVALVDRARAHRGGVAVGRVGSVDHPITLAQKAASPDGVPSPVGPSYPARALQR